MCRARYTSRFDFVNARKATSLERYNTLSAARGKHPFTKASTVPSADIAHLVMRSVTSWDRVHAVVCTPCLAISCAKAVPNAPEPKTHAFLTSSCGVSMVNLDARVCCKLPAEAPVLIAGYAMEPPRLLRKKRTGSILDSLMHPPSSRTEYRSLNNGIEKLSTGWRFTNWFFE